MASIGNISEFSSTSGDDILYINPNDFSKDIISGGLGKDTIIFNGNFEEWDFDFSYSDTGELEFIFANDDNAVQNSIENVKLSWTSWAELSDFEIFKFDDKSVDLSDTNLPTEPGNEFVAENISQNLVGDIKSNEFYAFGFNNNLLNSYSKGTLDLSDSDDHISMNGSAQTGLGAIKAATVNTYGGDDSIQIIGYGNTVVDAELNLGSGNDVVDISISETAPAGSTVYKHWFMPTFNASSVDMGSGNDWINVANGLSSSFDGGKGADVIVLKGNKNDYLLNEVGKPGTKNFYVEAVNDAILGSESPQWDSYSKAAKLQTGIKIYNFEKIQFDDKSLIFSSSYDKFLKELKSGASKILSKKINWKKFQEFSFADSKFYSALHWGFVNMKSLQKAHTGSIDWSKVQFNEFSSKQYKQTNWSQVDFDDLNKSSFKKINWSKVKTSSLSDQQYSDIDWSSIKLKGKKAPKLSKLNLSLLINSPSFSKKNTNQINWKKVDLDDISSSALSKLSSLGVKKNGLNIAELLTPSVKNQVFGFDDIK